MFGKVEELVVVLIIVLVLFGAKKLPQLSKGIAESVREVRKGFHDEPATLQEPTIADLAASAKSRPRVK